MRRLPLTLLPLLFALIALPGAAQTPAKEPEQLPGLQPIPEPPPLPVGVSEEDEPQITITQRGADNIEEYRAHGKLYMVKVTPPHGTPYYLVDEQGDGVMVRKNTLTSGTRPPMWVIKRW